MVSSTSLDTDSFAQYLANNQVPLLDVRTAEEYVQGHLPQAINIDLLQADFSETAQAILHNTEKLALYCRSGQRSKIAMQILQQMGYIVVELDEGIISWCEKGYTLQAE